MERMGFECLALDQDEVALSIAQSLKVDWRALAAPLPIVPGEVSGPVVEQTECGAHPQGTSAPAVSFGRHGGGGRERVAMGGGLAGSSTPAAVPETLAAGSGGVSGVAPWKHTSSEFEQGIVFFNPRVGRIFRVYSGHFLGTEPFWSFLFFLQSTLLE
ncbi:unnamed protein product [Ectocarpus sp. 12 AP-2014]